MKGGRCKSWKTAVPWRSFSRSAVIPSLVNGNPLENIQLVADPASSLAVIMKNGVDYKEYTN